MVQRFQSKPGHAVERRRCNDEDLIAGMAFHQERPVGFLRRMIQAADAPHLGRDQGLPGGLPLQELLLPGRHFLLPPRPLPPQSLLGVADAAVDLGNLPLLLGRIDPRLRFIGVIEKREQPVVFFLSQRVEFVRMALGALRRQAQHGPPETIDAVEHLHHAELLGDDRPLLVDHAIAEESRGDDLLRSRPGQQVSRQLFDQEPIVRHVAVQRVDHPVAPHPLFPRHVLLVSVGVGIACGIEPVPRPLLSESFALQQAFHRRLESILLEACQVGRRRWQADEIEGQPSEQGRRSSGRRETEVPFLQTGDHERVDRIGLTHLRNRDLPRGDERPMRFIRGPVADPLIQDVNLFCGQRFVMLRRRHPLGGIVRRHATDDLALVRLAGHDRRGT